MSISILPNSGWEDFLYPVAGEFGSKRSCLLLMVVGNKGISSSMSCKLQVEMKSFDGGNCGMQRTSIMGFSLLGEDSKDLFHFSSA